MAEGWQRLTKEEKESIQARFEEQKKSLEVENGNANGGPAVEVKGEREDEDVEMADEAEGGLSAVNHG